MNEFSHPVKVYLEDTDAGGIVYHVNYLKYMERARTEFLSQLGYDKPAILASGLILVVHSMNISFLRPALLSEQLHATARVQKLGRSYVAFDQAIKRNTEVVCQAEVKIACISQTQHKPKAMPAIMHDFLKQQLKQQSQQQSQQQLGNL
jgi:4-hydroxybenzoyl-CoA thioesterase/acyl-CoA thioester hydrolase